MTISKNGADEILREGKRQARIRAYEELSGKALNKFLAEDMVASIKHHPMDDAIINALAKEGK